MLPRATLFSFLFLIFLNFVSYGHDDFYIDVARADIGMGNLEKGLFGGSGAFLSAGLIRGCFGFGLTLGEYGGDPQNIAALKNDTLLRNPYMSRDNSWLIPEVRLYPAVLILSGSGHHLDFFLRVRYHWLGNTFIYEDVTDSARFYKEKVNIFHSLESTANIDWYFWIFSIRLYGGVTLDFVHKNNLPSDIRITSNLAPRYRTGISLGIGNSMFKAKDEGTNLFFGYTKTNAPYQSNKKMGLIKKYEKIVNKITDQNKLLDIVLMPVSAREDKKIDIFKETALKRIDNQDILLKVIYEPDTKAVNDDLRLIALNSINNSKTLSEITINSENRKLQLAACDKIRDENLLADIVRDVKDIHQRFYALEKIFNQQILFTIAQNDIDNRVQYAACDRISDETLLEKIGSTANDTDFRMYAIKKIVNQGLLFKFVQNDSNLNIRLTALQGIDNQKLIQQIVMTNTFQDVCSRALMTLTDPLDYVIVAKTHPYENIRSQAALYLETMSYNGGDIKVLSTISQLVLEKNGDPLDLIKRVRFDQYTIDALLNAIDSTKSTLKMTDQIAYMSNKLSSTELLQLLVLAKCQKKNTNDNNMIRVEMAYEKQPVILKKCDEKLYREGQNIGNSGNGVNFNGFTQNQYMFPVEAERISKTSVETNVDTLKNLTNSDAFSNYLLSKIDDLGYSMNITGSECYVDTLTIRFNYIIKDIINIRGDEEERIVPDAHCVQTEIHKNIRTKISLKRTE